MTDDRRAVVTLLREAETALSRADTTGGTRSAVMTTADRAGMGYEGKTPVSVMAGMQ